MFLLNVWVGKLSSLSIGQKIFRGFVAEEGGWVLAELVDQGTQAR